MQQKSFSKILLLTTIVIVVTGGFFVWFKNGKSSEVQFVTSIDVKDPKYTEIELEQVKTYSEKSASDMINTSGTIVGLDLDRSSLLISDNKENYVLVVFARAFRSTFSPIFSSLKIGDVIEIRGSPMFTKGELVDGTNGKSIKNIGVNMSKSQTFGMVSLAGINIISPKPNISTWKTYTNNENGFEFKYPSDWFYYQESVGKYPRILLLKNAKPTSVEGTESFAYGDQIVVSVDEMLGQWNKKLTKEEFIEQNYPDNGENGKVIKEEVVVAGQPMLKIEQGTCCASGQTLQYLYFDGSEVYTFYLYPYAPNDPEHSQSNEYFQKLLKSFVFIIK